MILNILTFFFIFGLIVVVHEFGHFYFAKKSGILVREFAIGMGPKIFSHQADDGTLYTIRILPVGGYVRMAGWGEDTTEIKTGQAAHLSLNEVGLVTRINLSQRYLDKTSLPMNVTHYDLEDKLEISGRVLDETRTYVVHHDATIIEEDGTELRIAPRDVQYQQASLLGRLMTNFAGPMNNFILGLVTFTLLVFMQGGVVDTSTNQLRILEGGAAAEAGLKTGDTILQIDDSPITDWQSVITAVKKATKNANGDVKLAITYQRQKHTETVTVQPKKQKDSYYIGVKPGLKTGFLDKVMGGLSSSWNAAFTILNALKNILLRPSLDQLGGPVAIFQVSSEAVRDGLESILGLLALLSINLGIVNLIPIPALDGGKIVLNLLEAIRRKPLDKEVESKLTIAGALFMVGLMIAVTWNDLMRLF